MATFSVDNTARTPFGKNAFLRSTQDIKTDSYTVAADSFPANVTVDGVAKKVLQPGTVMAMITSGADSGKIGVYDENTSVGITDGRQTAANIVGIAETFVPWMLEERDVDIAVVYEAAVVAAWCLGHDDGVQETMTAPTQADVTAQVPTILFK